MKVKINKKTFLRLRPFAILVVVAALVYIVPRLPKAWNPLKSKSIAGNKEVKAQKQGQSAEIFAQINPPKGYELNTTYGDIGPKMLEMGVIDFEKFKQPYDQSGQKLTQEQLDILTKGANKKIKISTENSYFLLNFFWAFGLANQSKILTEGEMVKGGIEQAGGFASTGGWDSVTKSGKAMDYYAKRAIVPLSDDQEKLVKEVASNVYRPCCGNSTAFPDCNHGMALLGIFELMAAQGATQSEMYEAGKYFNSFWFPTNAFDAALYFKDKYGQNFKEIDAKSFLGKEIFSAFGAQNVKKYLVEKGIKEEPPAQGGGCGV